MQTALAIAAHFDDRDIDVPVELPAHADVGNEPCVQMHFERNRRCFVEILTAASGVYLILHRGGKPGQCRKVNDDRPYVVAELVIGISG